MLDVLQIHRLRSFCAAAAVPGCLAALGWPCGGFGAVPGCARTRLPVAAPFAGAASSTESTVALRKCTIHWLCWHNVTADGRHGG